MATLFNPIQTVLFWIFSDRGEFCPPPPPRNFQNIQAMTVKLRGYIVCPKTYLLVCVTWYVDVISRDNYVMMSKQPPSWIRHLGFQNFSKRQKTAKNY